MGYVLDEAQKALVANAHEFCEKEIKPNIAQWDRDGVFPLESYKRAMDLGFHIMEIPEEYGGLGLSYVTVAAVMEEFGKYDLGYATTIMGTTLSLKTVLMNGTDAQKQMYADVIIPGGIGAFALTEPNAGSDAASVKTKADKVGDEYILNGSKCFITNAQFADIFVVFASTDREKGVKGLSAFIVEADRPGITIDKDEDKMGIRTSNTASVTFQDVHIPADHLLGKEGSGFKYAMQTLDLARPVVGAAAVGLAQRCVDEAGTYMKQRICFGKPIARLQALQFMLADMEIRTETARQMVAHCLSLADQHIPYGREAAIAKCYAGDIAFQNASDCIQILGGYGYSREYPVEKLLRDAKVLQIYEGTNQVQRVVVSGHVLARY